MRPMSLLETGHATGLVSLQALLDGELSPCADPGLRLADLIERVCIGGWPHQLNLSLQQSLRGVRDYLEEIRRLDISRADDKRRDPEKVGRLLRSLARNVATEVAVATLARDVSGSADKLDDDTVRDYLAALDRLMIAEDQPVWSPHLRSRSILRQAPKRHFVDPSLAVAALRATPDRLRKDLAYFGLPQMFVTSNQRNCAWSPLCNRVSGNRAANGGGFDLQQAARLSIADLEALGNRANSGSLIRTFLGESIISIESGWFHHNGGTDHSNYLDTGLIRNQNGPANFDTRFSTIVDNDVQFATILAYAGVDGVLSLWASIVDDPAIPPSSAVPPAVSGSVFCVIVNNAANLSSISGTHVYAEVPQFVDRANHNYHLTAAPNRALDECSANAVGPDVDGEQRGHDLTAVPNADGPFDMGFDEYIPLQAEFCARRPGLSCVSLVNPVCSLIFIGRPITTCFPCQALAGSGAPGLGLASSRRFGYGSHSSPAWRPATPVRACNASVAVTSRRADQPHIRALPTRFSAGIKARQSGRDSSPWSMHQ